MIFHVRYAIKAAVWLSISLMSKPHYYIKIQNWFYYGVRASETEYFRWKQCSVRYFWGEKAICIMVLTMPVKWLREVINILGLWKYENILSQSTNITEWIVCKVLNYSDWTGMKSETLWEAAFWLKFPRKHFKKEQLEMSTEYFKVYLFLRRSSLVRRPLMKKYATIQKRLSLLFYLPL